MTRRSVCPSCRRYFGWWYSFKAKDFRCPDCGVMVKESRGSLALSIIAGVLLGAVYILARLDVVHWAILFAWFAAVFAGGFVLHPFLVAYEQISLGPVCRGCRYELTGVEGGSCPECGEAIDVPLKPAGKNPQLVDEIGRSDG